MKDPRVDDGAATLSFSEGATCPPANDRPDATVPLHRPVPNELPVVPLDYYDGRREIARGGLGRVIEANDTRLGRKVALKELLNRRAIDNQRRFLREARITARLQHPSIVPVYEAGYWPSGAPFYAMKLIAGDTLDDLVELTDDFAGRLALLSNVIAVVDAVAYAHSRRVIHRDLKPPNIIIGAYGETLVVDWGLAKDVEGDGACAAHDNCDEESSGPSGQPTGRQSPGRTAPVDSISLDGDVSRDLTLVGSIMGTPGFMAPEQARGAAVDERADIYSLGAILYFLVTARQAFACERLSEFLHDIANRAPRPIAELVPDAPADLTAIVEKAMARDADERYQHATELSEDLKRFLNGQRVSVHHYSAWALIERWIGRHRALVSLAAVLLLALAVTAAVSVQRVVSARDAAQARFVEAERAKHNERERNHELILTRAALADDATVSVTLLERLPDSADNWPEARLVATAAHNRGIARHVWSDHDDSLADLALSPDGSLLASASYDGTLRLRPTTAAPATAGPSNNDLDGSRPVHVIRAHAPAMVSDIAFSPAGGELASTGGDMKVKTWTYDGTLVRVFDDHQGRVNGVAYSPDGRYLAYGDEAGTIHIRDLQGDDERRLTGGTSAIIGVAFAPDGSWLASSENGGAVRLWSLAADPDNQPPHRVLAEHGDFVSSLAFSPDGRLVVSTGADDAVVVSPVAVGAATSRRFAVDGDAVYAEFSPTRPNLLAASSMDGSVHLLDLANDSSQVLGVHEGGATQVVFSPDGKYLASGGADRAIRVFSIESGGLLRWYRTPDNRIWRLLFARDGQRLWSGAWSNTLREWDLREPTQLQVAHRRGRPVQTLAISGTMSDATSGNKPQVLAGYRAGELVAWDVTTGAVRTVYDHDSTVTALVVTASGQTAFAGTQRGQLWRHDLATGEHRHLVGHDDRIRALRLSADQRYLVSASSDRKLALWSVSDGAQMWLGHHGEAVRDVEFAPDGQILASAGGDVRLWRVADGQRLSVLDHPASAHQLAFTPDGQSLATGGLDHIVRLWPVAGGPARELSAHRGAIVGLEFSPDGKRLVSLGRGDRHATLWHLDSGASTSLRAQVPQVSAWHPDSGRLATVEQNGALRLWNATSGRGHVIGKLGSQLDALAYSRDGAALVTGSRNGEITLWRDHLPMEREALRTWLDERTSAVFDPVTLTAATPSR